MVKNHLRARNLMLLPQPCFWLEAQTPRYQDKQIIFKSLPKINENRLQTDYLSFLSFKNTNFKTYCLKKKQEKNFVESHS